MHPQDAWVWHAPWNPPLLMLLDDMPCHRVVLESNAELLLFAGLVLENLLQQNAHDDQTSNGLGSRRASGQPESGLAVLDSNRSRTSNHGRECLATRDIVCPTTSLGPFAARLVNWPHTDCSLLGIPSWTGIPKHFCGSLGRCSNNKRTTPGPGEPRGNRVVAFYKAMMARWSGGHAYCTSLGGSGRRICRKESLWPLSVNANRYQAMAVNCTRLCDEGTNYTHMSTTRCTSMKPGPTFTRHS